MPRRCAIFLMGPTATGKTELALRLADAFPVALINADSAQVYRGMAVGTAQPGPEVLEHYPHALLGFRDPGEPFSAGDFARAAREAAEEAFQGGRVPLLVGGTGLYFQAFEEGLPPLPAADPGLRRRLQEEGEEKGWPALHGRLAGVDPAAAEAIHPQDGQRIQRALEVYALTGRPLSELQKERTVEPVGYPILKLALWLSKGELWERIERRFRKMLEDGLMEEAEALRAADVDPEAPAMRAVGYRQARAFLDGEIDRDGLVEAGVVATRRLAKRQLTWLRRTKGVEWFRPEEGEAVCERVAGFLSSHGWI